jgi:amino acid permease
MPKKHIIEAISTLVGFTIGAGILGIPFVVAKAGFLTGILNILILGVLVLLLNLYLGEVTLRTKGIHQLTGYARIYLGKIGNYLMMVSFIIFSHGALIAYIIKTGEFLNALLNPIFGGTTMLYALIFFLFSFIIIYEGIRIVEKSEVWMVFLIFIIIIILAIFAIPNLNANNLTGFDVNSSFIPYGVVFFAFLATPAIPSMNEVLKNNKKELKKAIIIGSLIPLFIYILFALIVVGVTGVNTTDGAILGLASVLGNRMLVLGSILGILTMATSFIAVGFALTEMYHFDYRLKKKISSIFACFIPLVIAVAIINSNIKNAFFRVLDITGSVGGSLVGILIILIWLRAKKLGNRKPEYGIHKNNILILVIILMFILGVIFKLYEIFLL